MLKYLLILLLVVQQSASAKSYHNDKPCCLRKCTGSEYCSACKNCSACAYCNSGGYCGVCRPDAFKKPVKNTTVKLKTNNSAVKPNKYINKK